MDPVTTFSPQDLSSQSFQSTDAVSPVFDFDQAWTEHVTTLRTTTNMSTIESQSPPSSAAAPGSFIMEQQYDGSLPPAVQPRWTEPSAPTIPGAWDASLWADEQWSGVRQYYGAYSTSPQTMSSSNSFTSSASTSTLRSPTTSRGSKRSSAEMPSASSKRRRLADQSQDLVSKRSLFYVDGDEDDEEPGHQGPWEIVQGAWDASPPQVAPVIRVREMPPLREPAPRLPAQVWEATFNLVQ